jgi:hypothetical protein
VLLLAGNWGEFTCSRFIISFLLCYVVHSGVRRKTEGVCLLVSKVLRMILRDTVTRDEKRCSRRTEELYNVTIYNL